MFCSKCGAEITANAKFCGKCGQATGKPIEQQVTPNMSFDMSQQNRMLNADTTEKVEEKKRGSGKKFVGILLLLLLLVVLVVTIGYLGKTIISGHAGQMNQTGSGSDPDEEEVSGHGKEKEDEEEDEEEEENIQESDEDVSTDTVEEKQKYTGEKKNVSIEVHQVDTSKFPEVTLYASILDESGDTVEEMGRDDFTIQEIDAAGNVKDAVLDDVYQVLNEDNINVNLVLDASGSMDSYNKMPQAKTAAKALVNQMNLTFGDKVEVISFDNYVYLEQEFSSLQSELENAIDGISTRGATALYDALYAGLYQTHFETGAKCVIGFTDGEENSSSYTFDDVVNMARNTGIPVFIIGIGDEYDSVELQQLANLCSGRYYSADVTDLDTILEDIYVSIYREQQDYYVLKYTSENTDNVTQFREVVVETSDYTEFSGSYRKSYIPEADISGAFSASYMNQDFMISDSDVRQITEADLSGMSLAQLRIARNEIFARHGRQFKDSMLNQWFYSKAWYLNVPNKYAPDDFDSLQPSPMSALELQNANFIKQYEENLMQQRDIYPDASNVLLSDYDLALSKVVLKRAYQQMQGYYDTSILQQNLQMVSEAINKEDMVY